MLVAAGIGTNWYLTRNHAEADPYWTQADNASKTVIDHGQWQQVLDDYLVVDSSGINLFDYEGLAYDESGVLDHYLAGLAKVDPGKLGRSEQMSFWINLYNALTVRLIARNFPVDSITSLGDSVTSKGPWDDLAIEINQRSLSLNDIEHKILRPIFDDHRVHFAVNCASIGCPNLAPVVFTAGNIETLLTDSASGYLSHPRALRFDGDQLHLSSLFKWYQQDFGDDFQSTLKTLAQYAPEELRERLINHRGDASYAYDWSLNSL